MPQLLQKEKLIERMGLKTVGNIRGWEVLENLERDTPHAFKNLQFKVSNYPGTEAIPVKDVQAICGVVLNEEILADRYQEQIREAISKNPSLAGLANLAQPGSQTVKQVSKEEYGKLANNLCSSFSAIGTAINSPIMVKACAITQNSLKMFSEFEQAAVKAGKVVDKMSAVGFSGVGFAGVATLANPYILAGTALVEIFTMLSSSGPSFEEVVFEQLQMISNQIYELHKDMLRQIGGLHEHLDKIYKEIKSDIKELQKQALEAIKDLQDKSTRQYESLNARLNISLRFSGQASLAQFTQELKKILREAQRAIADKIDNKIRTKNEIEQILNDLKVGWIIDQAQCAAPLLNGLAYYSDDHNKLKDEVIILGLINERNIAGFLGYLGEIAAPILGSHPNVDMAKIINPVYFNLALINYINLQGMYPEVAQEKEADIDDIIGRLENTMNLVDAIQTTTFFDQLFSDYSDALQGIKQVTETHIDDANNEYREKFDNNYIDIKFNCRQTLEAINRARELKEALAKPKGWGSNILPELDLNLHGFLNYNLPHENYVAAHTFKVDPIEITYSVSAGYPVWSKGQKSILNCTIGGGYLAPDPEERRPCPWSYVGQVGTLDQLMISYGYICFDIDFNSNNKCVSCLSIKIPNVIGERLKTMDANGWSTYLKEPATFTKNGFQYNVWHRCPPNVIMEKCNYRVEAIKKPIIAAMINSRKELIAAKLPKNSCFDLACQKLDMAKQRLKIFSILAGLSTTLRSQICQLKDSASIKGDLDNYLQIDSENLQLLTDQVLDTPYFTLPSSQDVDLFQSEVNSELANKNTLTLNSEVSNLLLQMHQRLIRYKQRYLRAQEPRSCAVTGQEQEVGSRASILPMFCAMAATATIFILAGTAAKRSRKNILRG